MPAAKEQGPSRDALEEPNNPNATPEGHPHPITAAHERIFRENNLIASLDGAVDVRDYDGIRRLNAKYREEYPEDASGRQEGYDLIADCLEQASAEARARAEAYWKTQRGSPLRRYVRRHCLEGKAPL